MRVVPKLEHYCVVALLTSMDVGERYPRSEWPAHVTLAPNFVVDEPREQIINALRDANVGDRPLTFHLGGRALFGMQRNIPVLLAESPHVDDVHRDLADHLGRLRGFAADEPSHWRDGFRAHLTLQPTIAAVEGEIRTASHVAVVRLDGAAAEVVACFEIGGTPRFDERLSRA